MNLAEAQAECQRWLAYLDRQRERSIAIQKIASDRRTGQCSEDDGRKRLRAIDGGYGLTVYDGAKLSEAVKVLLRISWGR